MSAYLPPVSVQYLPGLQARARLINGDTMATVAEFALTEIALAGGVSEYAMAAAGAFTPTDSVNVGHFYRVRIVTAQNSGAFDDLTTAIGIGGLTYAGWVKNGQLLDGNVNAGSGNQVASFSTTKNQAITVTYGAFNTSTNLWVSNDQANHTLKIIADTTESTPSNAPVAKSNGKYTLSLTAGENSGLMMEVNGVSATPNVIIVPATWPNSASSLSRNITVDDVVITATDSPTA